MVDMVVSHQQGGLHLAGGRPVCGEPGPGLPRPAPALLHHGGLGQGGVCGPHEPVHQGLRKRSHSPNPLVHLNQRCL